MRIDNAASGYSRGRWAQVYDSGVNRAVPVTITPEHVVIGATGSCFRVTLSKAEVDSIYRLTYGIDWQRPEQEDNQP